MQPKVPHQAQTVSCCKLGNDLLMRTLTYQKAAAEAIMQVMEEDDRVFLIGEGVDNVTGVYGHVLPAYKKFGPKRVIDSPISENGLTGFCIGAALDGLRPILIHQRNDSEYL